MRENSPNVQVMKTYTCNVLLPRINCSTMRAESVNGPNVVLMNIHDDVCCVCTEASKDIFFFLLIKQDLKGQFTPESTVHIFIPALQCCVSIEIILL